MPYKFNPFTGTLDYYEDGGGDEGTTSFTTDFIVDDWAAIGGSYILNVQHNLESQKLDLSILENGVTPIIVDRFQIIDNNNIRVYTTIEPDCRYAGTIVIFKV